MPLGDNHVGSAHCDEESLEADIQYCLDRPDHYILFMGDNVDAGLRDSVGASVYEQKYPNLEAQVERWMEIARPAVEAGRVLGTHEGNHEERVYRSTGLDLTKHMARELGIPYFGFSVMHYVMLGDQRYDVFSTHGSGGARLPHTKIKAVLDRANMADADIYLMGHLHALDHHTRTSYAIDRREKRVVQKDKHFVLCGSYLKHWGSYGEKAGYEMLPIGSPKLKLRGDKHWINVEL